MVAEPYWNDHDYAHLNHRIDEKNHDHLEQPRGTTVNRKLWATYYVSFIQLQNSILLNYF